MVALYEEGATVYELADLFNCHRQTVSRQLKSRGVHMRLTGMTPEQVAEARCLYERGMTLRAVGKAVGISRNHVRANLVAAGVQLRIRTLSEDAAGPCR
jgi:DNA-binding transcriptional regulator LsrR (DeoR family)